MELKPLPAAASMLLVSVVALSFSMPAAAYAQAAQTPALDPTNAGKGVFKANCVGCHKWHGNGGGGYGGDAPSLRKTELTRSSSLKRSASSAPGTAMPFFTRGAYDEVKCHDMNRQEAGAQMPPEGGTFLRPKDIEAVTDYVIAHNKEPASPLRGVHHLLGSASRACDIYSAGAEARGCGRQHREGVMDRLKLSGIIAAGLLAFQALALANSPARTEEFSGNDLRDIRLGMAAAELEESAMSTSPAQQIRNIHWLAGRTGVTVPPMRVGRGDPLGYDPFVQPGF